MCSSAPKAKKTNSDSVTAKTVTSVCSSAPKAKKANSDSVTAKTVTSAPNSDHVTAKTVSHSATGLTETFVIEFSDDCDSSSETADTDSTRTTVVTKPATSTTTTEADDDLTWPRKKSKRKIKKPRPKFNKEDRKYRSEWETHPTYHWLVYNADEDKMRCTICVKTKKGGSFAEGSDNFQKSALDRHITSKEHKDAVIELAQSGQMTTIAWKLIAERDKSIISAIKTVYFLAKSDIPTHKYGDFLDFLEFQGCPEVKGLDCGQNATYRSDHIAREMQEAVALVIKDEIQEKIEKASFLSVLTDESTDIAVKKKMVVYLRIISDTMKPETLYICNVQISNGTAETIMGEMQTVLNDQKIPPQNVIGLGSDGAWVMTGAKNGVTGRMTREMNPNIINVHCIAHREWHL